MNEVKQKAMTNAMPYLNEDYTFSLNFQQGR